MSVVWLSIDPVNCKIDFYPSPIASKIENEFNNSINNFCDLGGDFFNAKVHFHKSGVFYQTTQGQCLGRYGFKQPGYRSVKRIFSAEGDKIEIYTKKVNGEWRIAKDKNDYDYFYLTPPKLLEKIIPPNTCVNTELKQNIIKILPWASEDLKSDALDANIIVWQWCRATPEDGDVMKLSDNWWVPYNSDITNIIEDAFNNNENTIDIVLPIIGKKIVEFNKNSCYAKQLSEDKLKVRIIRRITKTVQEVKEMFDNLTKPNYNFDIIIKDIPTDSIPHDFNCPILQDIMKDPVRTIDGFNYERHAIEKWFETSNKSPLTGLNLSSKSLLPCVDLKKMIEKFVCDFATK